MGAYVPTDGEIDVMPLVRCLVAGGAKAYFPRPTEHEDRLQFVPVPPAHLVPGRWGIPSPSHDVEAIPPEALDLVLVPGVVFDVSGARLGRGAGIYDRTFDEAVDPCPVLVGVAYAAQIVAQIPVERHDRRMDWLISEECVRCCIRGFRQ